MRDKHVDERIQQALELGASYTKSEKEDMWTQIESKLNHTDRQIDKQELEKKKLMTNTQPSIQTTKANNKHRKSKVMIKRITIAATITLGLLVAGAFTETGQAMIQEVKKKWFPVQKEVTQTMEGMTEKVNVKKQEVPARNGESKQIASYVIYINDEHFKLVRRQNESRIIPNNPLPPDYPEISMTIRQDPEVPPDQLAQMIYKELQGKYKIVTPPERVTTPLAGWKIYGKSGNKWNDSVATVYVTSNQLDGSFIFWQNLFLEAQEGWGLRMEEMMKEFYIEVSN